MSHVVNGLRPLGESGHEGRGVAEKALNLLTELARADEPLRLADLAQQTSMPKPTAYRMLATLCRSGFASSPSGGRYYAGPKLLGIAASALSRRPERAFVHESLLELQRETGHAAFFAIRHAEQAVYIDKVEAAQAYRIAIEVGHEVPLALTAIGRAMLIGIPHQEAASLLKDYYDDKDDAAEELRQSRVRGFAIEDEDYETNIRAVAAPVYGYSGEIIGAIGLAGLTFTLSEETLDVFGPLTINAAARVSEAMLGGGSAAVHG